MEAVAFGILIAIYRTSIAENASRWCWLNGTWDNYSNYTMCRDVRLSTIEPGVEITTTLYFIGYSLSLFTLIMAVCIFIYYKWVVNLNKMRNLKFVLFIILSYSKRVLACDQHERYFYMLVFRCYFKKTYLWLLIFYNILYLV